MDHCWERAGKKKCYKEKQDIREWQADYLMKCMDIRISNWFPGGERWLEVWLDESYCVQHHLIKHSWVRKKDEDETVKRGQRGQRGRRYVLLHAGTKDSWINQPPLIFEAKTSGDHHDNMCGEVSELPTTSSMKNADVVRTCLALGYLSQEQLDAGTPTTKSKTWTVEALTDLLKSKKYNPTPKVEKIAADMGITKNYVALENDGSSFGALKGIIEDGVKKADLSWGQLVHRAYAAQDAWRKRRLITTDHDPLSDDDRHVNYVIDLASDSDDESGWVTESEGEAQEGAADGRVKQPLME
ncbi:hypothetical protein HK104_000521 [Borealophlyctis nickersoniae]|nr:hypothetical protein HK104_000521 [Borealophlyctis nickersoniae]